MSKVWTSKIEQSRPKMSPYSKADFVEWCKKNEGATIRIEPEKKLVSSELRSFYFAAVIPAVRSTCDKWTDLDSTAMHEIIKKMFFYFEAWNPRTERMERFGKSVMSDDAWNSTSKAMKFLQTIENYLVGCGVEMPDSKEWIAIRDGRDDKVGLVPEYPSGEFKAEF